MPLRRLHYGSIASVLIVLLFVAPFFANGIIRRFVPQNTGVIAPLFTRQVQYWETDIARWSDQYDVDPNLMATIMQIESCGHPTVRSPAGANGLFQVMPFHFSPGEDMLNPENNALRSTNFVHECSRFAGGDVGLILACYNGGPSVVNRPFDTWAHETQRYYVWGTTIYQDAINNYDTSAHLDTWLQAGGQNLCLRASVALGIP
ncbi:MAG: transglycosylase SLT domain-containing protein [Chloroflexota bacterium]